MWYEFVGRSARRTHPTMESDSTQTATLARGDMNQRDARALAERLLSEREYPRVQVFRGHDIGRLVLEIEDGR